MRASTVLFCVVAAIVFTIRWYNICHSFSQAMVRSKEKYQKVVGTLIKKERRKRHRLKELGIDYDFPGYVSGTPSMSCMYEESQHQTFEH